MTDTTRKQIHDLLDRVLDAGLSPWPRFRLTRQTSGRTCIAVTIGSVSIEQEFNDGDTGDAVTRALEATA